MFDNGRLGMVKLEQEQGGLPEFGTELDNPDLAAVAAAMGLASRRVTEPDRLHEAMEWAFGVDGPCLLDVVTNPDEIAVPPKADRGPGLGLRHREVPRDPGEPHALTTTTRWPLSRCGRILYLGIDGDTTRADEIVDELRDVAAIAAVGLPGDLREPGATSETVVVLRLLGGLDDAALGQVLGVPGARVAAVLAEAISRPAENDPNRAAPEVQCGGGQPTPCFTGCAGRRDARRHPTRRLTGCAGRRDARRHPTPRFTGCADRCGEMAVWGRLDHRNQRSTTSP